MSHISVVANHSCAHSAASVAQIKQLNSNFVGAPYGTLGTPGSVWTPVQCLTHSVGYSIAQLFYVAQPLSKFPLCHLENGRQGEVFQSTNLHDAARCISSSLTSLGGIITTATPDPWTAVLSVPSIGVNSLGPVDLSTWWHLQICPGASWGKCGRVAGNSRCVGRALGRRGADGRIQKMSRRSIWSVYPCHDPPELQQILPLHSVKAAHFLKARWTCWRPGWLVFLAGSALLVLHRCARKRLKPASGGWSTRRPGEMRRRRILHATSTD